MQNAVAVALDLDCGSGMAARDAERPAARQAARRIGRELPALAHAQLAAVGLDCCDVDVLHPRAA